MPRRRRAGVLAGLLVVVVAGCSGGGSGGGHVTPSGTASATAPVTYRTPPATLPAIPVPLTTQPPPWLPPAAINNGADSAAYVAAAGFSSAAEMLQVHYHAHLDIEVDGKAVTVQPFLGWVVKGQSATGLAPLHTHDGSGIIHIENSVPATFVLGQFFVEWGVKFTPTCLGPYCTGHGKQLAVFVNGKPYTGDPTKLVLAAHQEIAVEYGATGHLPTPPSSYAFPSGL
jgi:hypothetical protein